MSSKALGCDPAPAMPGAGRSPATSAELRRTSWPTPWPPPRFGRSEEPPPAASHGPHLGAAAPPATPPSPSPLRVGREPWATASGSTWEVCGATAPPAPEPAARRGTAWPEVAPSDVGLHLPEQKWEPRAFGRAAASAEVEGRLFGLAMRFQAVQLVFAPLLAWQEHAAGRRPKREGGRRQRAAVALRTWHLRARRARFQRPLPLLRVLARLAYARVRIAWDGLREPLLGLRRARLALVLHSAASRRLALLHAHRALLRRAFTGLLTGRAAAAPGAGVGTAVCRKPLREGAGAGDDTLCVQRAGLRRWLRATMMDAPREQHLEQRRRAALLLLLRNWTRNATALRWRVLTLQRRALAAFQRLRTQAAAAGEERRRGAPPAAAVAALGPQGPGGVSVAEVLRRGWRRWRSAMAADPWVPPPSGRRPPNVAAALLRIAAEVEEVLQVARADGALGEDPPHLVLLERALESFGRLGDLRSAAAASSQSGSQSPPEIPQTPPMGLGAGHRTPPPLAASLPPPASKGAAQPRRTPLLASAASSVISQADAHPWPWSPPRPHVGITLPSAATAAEVPAAASGVPTSPGPAPTPQQGQLSQGQVTPHPSTASSPQRWRQRPGAVLRGEPEEAPTQTRQSPAATAASAVPSPGSGSLVATLAGPAGASPLSASPAGASPSGASPSPARPQRRWSGASCPALEPEVAVTSRRPLATPEGRAAEPSWPATSSMPKAEHLAAGAQAQAEAEAGPTTTVQSLSDCRDVELVASHHIDSNDVADYWQLRRRIRLGGGQ